MVALPLAHVSWAVVDNDTRKRCDSFFMDLFGAETAFEMLLTPDTAAAGFDREERLMVIGDTMLIPIAPAGGGERPDSVVGAMLRKNALPGRWIGVSLRVADLREADAWMRAKGFKLHYDPGMENHYFLVSPRQVLGMRLEFMVGELPNDPRLRPGWDPGRWKDHHPLGIEGLQSLAVSTPSLDGARAMFGGRLEWPEISVRTVEVDRALAASFLMGDTVIEALEPLDAGSPVARHLSEVQGIYALTFKVRSAPDAAAYLRRRGFDLIGDVNERFAVAPEQAFDRLIYFSDVEREGYPPLGSSLKQPPRFPAVDSQEPAPALD